MNSQRHLFTPRISLQYFYRIQWRGFLLWGVVDDDVVVVAIFIVLLLSHYGYNFVCIRHYYDDKRLFSPFKYFSKVFHMIKYVFYVKSNHYRSCKNTSNFPSWLLLIFCASTVVENYCGMVRGNIDTLSCYLCNIHNTLAICKSLLRSPFAYSNIRNACHRFFHNII